MFYHVCSTPCALTPCGLPAMVAVRAAVAPALPMHCMPVHSGVGCAQRLTQGLGGRGEHVVCGVRSCYWNYGEDCLITPPTVTGNLAWAMQLYYQVYLYTLDTATLKTMYPLLRRARVNLKL